MPTRPERSVPLMAQCISQSQLPVRAHGLRRLLIHDGLAAGLGPRHVAQGLVLGLVLLACGGADTSSADSPSSGEVDGNATGGSVTTSRVGTASSKTTNAASGAASRTSQGGSGVGNSSRSNTRANSGGSTNDDGSSQGGAQATGIGGAAPSSSRRTSTSAANGGASANTQSTGGRSGSGSVQRGGSAATVTVSTGGRAAGGTSGAGTGGTYTLDCGKIGWAVEAHGPPENRVNYVILGDGYSEAELVAGGKFEQHINVAMKKRFSVPIGEVYSRYRKFVNICAIKLVSSAAICSGKSALQCCGDDNSRLAECSYSAANSALKANLPASFVVDWRAVVLNGDSWWNTGAELMLWSGGHPDAAGAALHEGGHGFHWLADEYTEGGSNCTMESPEVNSTADSKTTAGKWDLWLNYDQVGATGLQSTYEGSNYCEKNQYRPSKNSMMNMLFGDDPDTSYNSVSREQMIFGIWRAVVPIDSTTPPAGAVSNPTTLSVSVVDPAVIDVDWSVDGTVVAAKGGETFDVAAQSLSSGTHTITAKAYDNAGEDLVRNRTNKCPAAVTGIFCSRTNWNRSQQTVSWTVTIP